MKTPYMATLIALTFLMVGCGDDSNNNTKNQSDSQNGEASALSKIAQGSGKSCLGYTYTKMKCAETKDELTSNVEARLRSAKAPIVLINDEEPGLQYYKVSDKAYKAMDEGALLAKVKDSKTKPKDFILYEFVTESPQLSFNFMEQISGGRIDASGSVNEFVADLGGQEVPVSYSVDCSGSSTTFNLAIGDYGMKFENSISDSNIFESKRTLVKEDGQTVDSQTSFCLVEQAPNEGSVTNIIPTTMVPEQIDSVESDFEKKADESKSNAEAEANSLKESAETAVDNLEQSGEAVLNNIDETSQSIEDSIKKEISQTNDDKNSEKAEVEVEIAAQKSNVEQPNLKSEDSGELSKGELVVDIDGQSRYPKVDRIAEDSGEVVEDAVRAVGEAGVKVALETEAVVEKTGESIEQGLESAANKIERTAEKAEVVVESGLEKTERVIEKVIDKAVEVKDDVARAAEQVVEVTVDTVKGASEAVAEGAKVAVENTGEFIEEVGDSIQASVETKEEKRNDTQEESRSLIQRLNDWVNSYKGI